MVVRVSLQSRLSNNNDIFYEVGHPVVMTIYKCRESNLLNVLLLYVHITQFNIFGLENIFMIL
jgi:hypothetical protein